MFSPLQAVSRRALFSSMRYFALSTIFMSACKNIDGEQDKQLSKRAVVSYKTICELYFHYPHSVRHAGELVCKVSNLFKNAGLNYVDFVPIDILPTGKFDPNQIQVFIADPYEVAYANSHGANLHIIAQIFHTNTYGIISKKDSPIQTPKDLIHKTIELPLHFNAPFSAILKYNAIDPQAVNIQNISGPYPVFDEKNCDGILGFETAVDTDRYHFTPLRAWGYTKMGQCLSVRRKLVEENPEFITNFMYAEITGWKDVLNNPTNSARMTCFYIMNNSPDFLRGQIQEAKKQISYIISPESKKNGLFTISETDKNILMDELVKLGMVFDKNSPDNALVNRRILEKLYAEYPELL